MVQRSGQLISPDVLVNDLALSILALDRLPDDGGLGAFMAAHNLDGVPLETMTAEQRYRLGEFLKRRDHLVGWERRIWPLPLETVMM